MLTDAISTVDIKDEKGSPDAKGNTISNHRGGLQGFINTMKGL